MTEHTLGTVPLRRRGPRQGLRLADPKQADRHRLARQRARDIVVVIKRRASHRGASPVLPPQGGGSPRGALPGGRGSNSRALVPLLQRVSTTTTWRDAGKARRDSFRGQIGGHHGRENVQQDHHAWKDHHAWMEHTRRLRLISGPTTTICFISTRTTSRRFVRKYLHHLSSSYSSPLARVWHAWNVAQ